MKLYHSDEISQKELLELHKELLSEAKFKIGDKVKVKCDNSPIMVVENITIKKANSEYTNKIVQLDINLYCTYFNKSTQEFVYRNFTEPLVELLDVTQP